MSDTIQHDGITYERCTEPGVKLSERQWVIMYGPIGDPAANAKLQELRDAIKSLRANSTSALPSTQQAR